MYTSRVAILYTLLFPNFIYSSELPQLLKKINNPRGKKTSIYKYQLRLIKSLKNEQESLFYPDDWHTCIAALKINNNFTYFSEESNVLQNAIDTFHKTPNFLKILQKILSSLSNNYTAISYIYLIKQAMLLHTNENPIYTFNTTSNNDNDVQQRFHLITKTHWYTFKAHEKWPLWHGSKAKKLKKQFIAQKETLDEHNKQHDESIIFEVRAPNKIPAQWQEFFNLYDIQFCTTNN